MRSRFTHYTGDGKRAGLYATNCWQRTNSPSSRNRSRARRVSVDISGRPGSQALPISITIEPDGARSSRMGRANEASHSKYSEPWRLPYFFFRLRGNGGDVKMRSTEPARIWRMDDC